MIDFGSAALAASFVAAIPLIGLIVSVYVAGSLVSDMWSRL
jgi:hypothetical protein